MTCTAEDTRGKVADMDANTIRKGDTATYRGTVWTVTKVRAGQVYIAAEDNRTSVVPVANWQGMVAR